MGEARLMSGNEAVAEGALAAGVRFFAGYPITPSTEIAEIMSERLPKIGGKFIQMEDELASLGAVIGASLAGLKSMTATSGPGFSLMQENIGFAIMAEVPCVVVDVQRAGPSTGIPTHPAQGDVMQARWGSHGGMPLIVLAPSSTRECFDLTVRAFNLSERYRTPVILLLDEFIGHVREKVVLPALEEIEVWERVKPTVPPEWYFPYDETESDVPPIASFGEGYRYNVTGLTHDRAGFPTLRPDEIVPLIERMARKIEGNITEIAQYEELFMDYAEMAIFAYGSPVRAAIYAVKQAQREGVKIGLVKITTLWPFPKSVVEEMVERVKTIIVPEMNLGQLVGEVERYNQGRARIYSVNRFDGEPITPQEILDKIREVA